MSKEEKKYKSKWFRIAVAGDTTDGREIQASWIIQMAQNYNPNTYGARINVEHIRSVFPGGLFGAYGDVLALKTEKVTIDGEEKDALFAQIEPTESLIQLNKQKQKVYTSIEVDENFAGKGSAYLVGLVLLGWQTATNFIRTDESVLFMQNVLNLSTEQVDEMWEYAMRL